MNLPVQFLFPAAALAVAGIGLFLLWARTRRQPRVKHSQVDIHKNLTGFPLLGWLPTLFFFCFIASLSGLCAWAVFKVDTEEKRIESRDALLAVDFSGSMGGIISAGPPEGLEWPVDKGQFRRIDLAQWAVKQFVAKRQGDRVGLMVFDDATYKHWPMTDDLKIILRKADLIGQATGGGTNFQGPTEHDKRFGPIQAAIEHFKEYGKAKTKVLILVTDGEAPISDQRMQELIAQMKEVGGKIYVLGIGEDWTNPSSFSAGQTEPIRKLVAALGGKCFAVGDAKQMAEAVSFVDQLEKSQVVIQRKTDYPDAYQYFAAASVISLLLLAASVLITREIV